MALEDYLEPEIGVTAVVTAAIFSPTARSWIRRCIMQTGERRRTLSSPITAQLKLVAHPMGRAM
jgi:hypothetical protein